MPEGRVLLGFMHAAACYPSLLEEAADELEEKYGISATVADARLEPGM